MLAGPFDPGTYLIELALKGDEGPRDAARGQLIVQERDSPHEEWLRIAASIGRPASRFSTAPQLRDQRHRSAG